MYERRRIEPNPNYLQDLFKKALQPNSQDLFKKLPQNELEWLLEASKHLNRLFQLQTEAFGALDQARKVFKEFEKHFKQIEEQKTIKSIFDFLENHKESFSEEEWELLIRHFTRELEKNYNLS
jgi:hypothetical protein